MTRRPIIAGIATILALVLTAGLAYGAGRMVSTRSHANQVGRQDPRMVALTPGFGGFYGSTPNARFAGPGTAFRDQMRQWMWDRFQSWLGHARVGANRWTTTSHDYGRMNTANHGPRYRGGGSSHPAVGSPHHLAYHHRHDHMGSWGGGYGGCCGW